MIKKIFYQELKFWIEIIVIILIVSNLGISMLKSDWYTKIGLLISLNASLLGGLITLISITITNQYYNKQKLENEKEEKIEDISMKLKALQFLKEEFIMNKNKFNTKSLNEKFQTVVWEEFRREFVEIFINNPKEELFEIQRFYVTLMEQNNSVSTYKIEQVGLEDLLDPIEKYINNAIVNYEQKLNDLKSESY